MRTHVAGAGGSVLPGACRALALAADTHVTAGVLVGLGDVVVGLLFGLAHAGDSSSGGTSPPSSLVASVSVSSVCFISSGRASSTAGLSFGSRSRRHRIGVGGGAVEHRRCPRWRRHRRGWARRARSGRRAWARGRRRSWLSSLRSRRWCTGRCCPLAVRPTPPVRAAPPGGADHRDPRGETSAARRTWPVRRCEVLRSSCGR